MNKTKKLTLAGILVAIAVVGSTLSFPVFGAKCSPVQHMVNVISAVLLGPWWGVGMAFVASVIRVIFGLGSLMAFPGSMVGALLAGVLYNKVLKKIPVAALGELFGTSVLGGILAYPVAYGLMGNAEATLFGYIIPFFVSSLGGTVIATVFTYALSKVKKIG